MSRNALRFRGAWAVAAALGFWVLAVGLVAALVAGGFAVFVYAPDDLVSGLAMWGLAGALAVGVAPRVSFKQEPLAPALALGEHQRLHAFVRDVARRAGAPAPDRLQLFHEANAFAALRKPSLFGKRESVVGIGLPLLAVLSESEARSVLAHEMGHHVAGDVKLGPWVHRTRRALARAADKLEGSSFWLHLPFVAYAELFLKASTRVSRAQELAADALAAKIAGTAVTASALRKTEIIGSAWETYFHSEVVPILARGRLPPLLEGWDAYWRAAQTPDTPAFAAVEQILKASRSASDEDTHPPLHERIAALGDPAPVSDDARSALALLDDVPEAESKVLYDLLVDGAKLTPIAWDRVVDEVWLPLWREATARAAQALAKTTARDVPRALARWEDLALATRQGVSAASPEAERRRVARFVATWLTLKLADDGWTIDAAPGRAVSATRGGAKIEPFTLIADAKRPLDAERWGKLCEELGL